MRVFFLILFLTFVSPVWAVSESQMRKAIDKASEIESSADLLKLVEELTRDLKKDEDKAYILLSWIVKNIDYDDYKMRMLTQKATSKYRMTEVPESGDILKTRLGTCEDIANLYKQMLEKAGLKAVVIKGCVGDVDKNGGCKDGSVGHAWNAVWIDKQWEFVDPTQAITGRQVSVMEDVTKKKKYEKELVKREKKSAHTYEVRQGRQVDKRWFMTAPKTMAEGHHPYDEKWFLMKIKDRRNKNL